MQDAVVIGGGITGLCCALQLSKRHTNVTLAECAEPGGSIRTTRENGFTLEHGPNVLLENPPLRRLLTEAGLETAVVYPQIERYKQYVWHGGSPAAVPKSPLAFFSSPLFSPADRLLFLPRLFQRGLFATSAEDLSVAEFFGRVLSERTIRNLLDPALKGIYGGDAWKLSARSLFPELWRHLSAGGSLMGYMNARRQQKQGKRRLLVLRGGLHTLVDAILRTIEGRLELRRQQVAGIISKPGGFAVTFKDGSSLETKAVYVTTSGESSAALLANLDPELSRRLAAIRYAALAVVHIGCPRSQPVPADSFGVLFPRGHRLLGIMYNSSLFPHLAPGDQHLLTVCLGGAERPDAIQLTDEQLYSEVREELMVRLGISNTSFLHSCRWTHAIPQYEVGHHRITDAMDGFEARFPGIYLLGVDRPGVSVPDRIKAVYRRFDEQA